MTTPIIQDEFKFEVWVSRSEFMDLDRRFCTQESAELCAANASATEEDTLHEVWVNNGELPLSQWENGKQVTI